MKASIVFAVFLSVLRGRPDALRGELMGKQYCPRCKTVLLAETEHYRKIRFFLCSNCSRRYALEPGKALTSRWLEAVILPLHQVYPYEAPIEQAARIAQKFVSQFSTEQLDWIVEEIRLELDDPTQQVRDALNCKASEVVLRQYLFSFCEHVERLRS
jgi:transposase-like protein